MFRILSNTFLGSRTKCERRLTEALDSDDSEPELVVDTETPETILMKRCNSQLLQGAIDDLPVHHRETLLLCEVEKMSYQGIAARKVVRESLGSTPGAPPSKHLSHQIETHERDVVG
jgi:DNA-directed RNA polymerase specialized sigma24 family protein